MAIMTRSDREHEMTEVTGPLEGGGGLLAF